MSYFKFVSEDRIDILENGCIRFTPASDFNDPLEFKPCITELSEIDLPIEKQWDRIDKLPQYQKKLDEILSQYGVLSLFRNDSETALVAVMHPSDKRYNDEPRHDIKMWSEYANNHKGMIIEFSNTFFSGECKKVIYSATRPLITYEEIDELDRNKLDEITLTKKNIWNGEYEYRVIKKLVDADIKKGESIQLFKFDKKHIKSITLGCKVTSEFKAKVIDLLKHDPDLRHVQIFTAQTDPAYYGLTIMGGMRV